MKKFIFTVALAVISLFGVLSAGCAKSDSQAVGTYFLVTATADNGSGAKTYTADGSNSVITKNSFILEIKDNYRWNMIIALPAISETEDGKWEEKNGKIILKEDRDDPEIVLNYENGKVTFNITEDGYVLAVTLDKNS